MVKFQLIEKMTLPLKYRGQKAFQMVFKPSSPIDSEMANAFLTKQSKALKKAGKDGDIANACLFPYSVGWRASKVVPLGDDVYVYNPYLKYGEDVDFDDTITKIIIYILPKGIAEGGANNKFNDCLFICLLCSVGKQNLPKCISSPKKLKKYLGLNRCDKVNINLIPKLEEAFSKYSISVYGDAEYISNKDRPNNIKLKLKNQHYTVHYNDGRIRQKGTAFKPFTKDDIRVFDKNKKQVTIYDGKDEFTISLEEFLNMKRSYKYLILKKEKDKTFEDTLNDYVKDAETILKLSDGLLNLYKYPTIRHCSLDMWRMKDKTVKEHDKLDVIESSIIDKAFKGGLMYSHNGYEGFGKCLDMNAMYSTLMNSIYLQIPTKSGEFKTLTTEEFDNLDYFKHGFYHCIIKKSGDINKDKLFSFNSKNWYCHYDLQNAKQMGLEIEIITDEQANHYYYSADKLVKARFLYGEFIKYIMDLLQKAKNENLPKSVQGKLKLIRNSLWGSFMKRGDYHIYLETEDEYEIKDNLDIISLCPRNDDSLDVKVCQTDSRFESVYARMGTFLTAYCRLHFRRQVEKYSANIVRIHTDSILLNEDIKTDLNISDKLGDWKLEKIGKCKITHLNKVEWS